MINDDPEIHEDRSRVVVVSYVPLLPPNSPIISSPGDQAIHTVLQHVEACPDGHVEACLWVAKGDAVMPVFVMERAHAIADHLTQWSEQRPDEWFSLCLVERGGRYVAVLFPNLKESLNRFCANQLHLVDPDAVAGGCGIVFRCLHFVSGPQHVFESVRSKVPARTMVGFLDVADLDRDHPEDVAPEQVMFVGPVAVPGDCRPFGMDVSALMEDLLESSSMSGYASNDP